jgi:hypothetical protein
LAAAAAVPVALHRMQTESAKMAVLAAVQVIKD